MHGELGNKLVQHAKRTLALPTLPPYQTELVRSITREVRDLDRDVSSLLNPFITNPATGESSFNPTQNPDVACALLVDHLSMRRNKRCLLAYQKVRADKLEGLAWEGREVDDVVTNNGEVMKSGGTIAGGSEEGKAGSLSPEEQEYFRAYGDLLSSYKGVWTDVDLTGSLEPPRDLFVDVRVLKDAGEIQTEYGAINLTKNSQFFVRLGDVERLIALGFLQRLS